MARGQQKQDHMPVKSHIKYLNKEMAGPSRSIIQATSRSWRISGGISAVASGLRANG
jgi:hypothetical protein